MQARSAPPAQTSFAAIALIALVGASGASAQDVEAPEPSTTWRFTLGAGAFSVPKYPGSDERKIEGAPLLGARYGRFFIGGIPGSGTPTGLGAFLIDNSQWKLGVGIGARFSRARTESDDARLHGLGDIDNTPRASLFADYSARWWGVRGGISTDVGGNRQGTLATLDLEAKYRLGDRVSFSAGPGLTWADGKYTQTFFGIDAAQASRSGRPQYSAEGGLNSVRFSVGMGYLITPQWRLDARASLVTLRGDAADSPITLRKSQNVAALFVSYRF